MKKELLPALLLSILCVALFAGIYPLIVWGIAQAVPGKGNGFVTGYNGRTYYANVAQKFTEDKYFCSRPSAVDYNAAGSGGSNKGPANPDYLAVVQARVDSFHVHNPGVKLSSLSSDMVTASGSGLDPDISVQGAMAQAQRIADKRHLALSVVNELIKEQRQKPLWGLLGPEKINVLQLNIELDKLK